MSLTSTQINYASLSLKDLLAARDAYHWHLMNKANVVGTAVGLYLIRKQGVDDKEPRTFANSEVRSNSWPCVVVLVNDWVASTEFGGDAGIDPTHMVPRTLYLSDGRAAPVCVVLVKPGTPAQAAPALIRWPESYVGGGCPLFAEVQGDVRRGTVGCLVTDGHKTFALTNRHVAGEPDTVLSASLRGDVTPVGVASKRSLTRLPLDDVFPTFSAQRTFLTLDVGLVDVDVVGDWTSRVFGLEGELGAVVDLNEDNLGTQLIDQRMEAFGAVSGHLVGRIKALFYRHKALAGYEYVSEFLIAPEDGQAQTCPGDSGMVWHLVQTDAASGDRTLQPLAVEWGGQGLIGSDDRTLNFSLATGLATACQLLDVDLVRTGDTGAQPFWGQTGHYSIAEAAIELVRDPTLKAFLKANLERISFRPDQLSADQIRAALSAGDFVELADVPDLVWKKVKGAVPGGRDYHQNAGPEHPNHYADIDKPDANGGQSLRDMVIGNRSKLTVGDWQAWYEANSQKDAAHQGILPFRVWQLFKVMIDALVGQRPEVERFLCAAGVISHYIGDACQPLHGSYLSDGYQDRPVATTGKTKKWQGKGVHSAYEDKMVDMFSGPLLDMILPAARAFAEPIPAMTDGSDAAFATVSLMAYCAGVIPPSELCDKYIELGGGTSKPVIQGLWTAFGPRTGEVMAAGACYLAAVWDAAYLAGGQPALAAAQVSDTTLAGIYQDEAFAPSLTLDKIGAEL
ncbi:hypothetical protein [Sphingomonas sp. PAMC 26605]|uniref:hypothetical protein n=1 Tax=Sphingomonas sp. PAMC 26605 TaxID=1112214 RepID=UPI00026CD82F|nr:hypothetical protein [Sphingomonas sp. PAMC 26605]